MTIKKYLLPIAAGIALFGIYAFSTTRVPAGYADSDELITTATFFGVAHPPGFPLLITLAHGFVRLFHSIPPSLVANLLSSLFHTLAVICFYYLTKIITKSTLASATAAAILGFSYLWWTYAVVFEVTAFSSLLAITTLLVAFRWYTDPKTLINRDFWLTWVCAGIALGHYQPVILLFPGLLFMVIDKLMSSHIHFKKTILSTCLGLILLAGFFLLSNVPLFWQNQHRSVFSWDFVQSVSGWKNHLVRNDYIGNDPETTTYDSAFALPKFDQVTLESGFLFFQILMDHFGIVSIIIAILGGISLWSTNKKMLLILSTFFILSGPAFVGYMRVSDYTFDRSLLVGTAQRQMMLGEISFALFLGFGIAAVLTKIPPSKKFVVLLAALLVFWSNRSVMTNPISRLQANKMAVSRLQSAEPNALIICTNDIDCYSIFYISLVEKMRPDIQVLAHAPLYRLSFLKTNPDYYPYADFEVPDFFPQLIAWNLPRRPVYITSGVNFYPEYIGWENGPFYLKPEKFLFKVTTSKPIDLGSPESMATIANLDPRDEYGKGIIETVSNSYAYAGYLSLLYQNKPSARGYFSKALELNQNNNQAQELLVSLDSIEWGTASPSGEALIRQATYTDPTNIAKLELLRDFYLRIDDPRAQTISEHIDLFRNGSPFLREKP